MKKKYNLSLFIYSLAGGGAERVISVLLEKLRDKYDITLVLMRDTIEYEIPKMTKIHFLENSKPHEMGILKLLKLPYLGWKYKKFCQKNDIDISLAFTNRPSYISIFSKWFGSSSYTVISERTTPSMMYSKKGLLSSVNKFLIRHLYSKSDFIISNSEGNRLDLIENFSIRKEIISTIHNPFDFNKIETLSYASVGNVDFDKFTFISVGRLDVGKNHQLMIEAFSAITNKDTQLVILGEGVLRKKLEEQIKSLGLEDRVFLLGFDNNPYKYFLKANCFVFTSNYEGFPNVLVEALACRLPVISTDCKSGPREILAPESDVIFQLDNGMEVAKHGLLVSLNNQKGLSEAMMLMINDGALREKYEKYANDIKDRFSERLIIEKYVNVLSVREYNNSIKEFDAKIIAE